MMPAEQLEQPACPLCGAVETQAKRYDLQPYGVVQCTRCRLWYLSPRLNESDMLKRYADDTYFNSGDASGYTAYAAQQDSLRLTFRRFVEQLRQAGYTGGRLLEVGCGYGYLLAEAKPHFTLRVGTDYSLEALKHAAEVCDRVIHGGVDEISPDEHFDTIITVGVIEHIYKPLEFNNKLRSHLAPGGKLIHATPHMGSFWRHLMGRRWASFKVPEHVTYYDANSLARLFAESGFTPLRRFSFPHAFPMSLVAEKLGMQIGGNLGKINVWLPATTLAMGGVR